MNSPNRIEKEFERRLQEKIAPQAIGKEANVFIEEVVNKW